MKLTTTIFQVLSIAFAFATATNAAATSKHLRHRELYDPEPLIYSVWLANTCKDHKVAAWNNNFYAEADKNGGSIDDCVPLGDHVENASYDYKVLDGSDSETVYTANFDCSTGQTKFLETFYECKRDHTPDQDHPHPACVIVKGCD